MIPALESILQGYKDGTYTFEQCLAWLEQHKDGSYSRGYDDGRADEGNK